ncbi:MAG: GNAT family N-acetyltransferase [Acidobacteriota bacterium]
MSHPHQADLALAVSFAPSMGSLDPKEWNRLAAGAPPFLRWEWLNLLETCGAVSTEAGWMPAHCSLRVSDRLVAAAPLYVKGHGQGEFVYDQLWADVAQRLNLPYYPKLVAVSPFTPVAAYRFLTAPGFSRHGMAGAVLEGMERLIDANELSGLHVLFAQDDFADDLESLGLTAWEHQGFIWENRGYGSFEDFLEVFRTGQRKNIRRERRALRESGVRVEVVEGVDAPDSWFELMHHYYAGTCSKFGEWGCKYLPLSFFQGLADVLRGNVAFAAGFMDGRDEPVGLSMLVHGDGELYGRYSGAALDIPFLHFELCYYAPIAWAIERGLHRFDPGMGGEHKPRRGFTSRVTRSLHRFSHPVMAHVFHRHIPEINALTREHVQELQDLCAFKREGRP